MRPLPTFIFRATSAFGLNIVKRGRDGPPERMKKGGPGAGWMKGQFGLDLQGGPGAIYKSRRPHRALRRFSLMSRSTACPIRARV